MDQVHREIVAKYQVDGIFANRWAPQGGDCYCIHCQRNFKDGDRPRACRARPTPAIRRGAVPRVAQGAADRALEAAGTRPSAPPIPTRASSPTARRISRPPASSRHPVHRQPGAPRRDAAVDERPARQGVPLGHGPPADRRHLQRRARRAVPLEGLGAERAGNPALGRRGHGQRHAAVGDEVLRRALRPALAADRRAHLPVARRARALPAQRAAARARRAAALRADRRRSIPASRRAIAPAITCSACITRSSRRGCRSRWCTRRFSRPIGSTLQAADPGRRRGAVRRAVRRDPRVRRARRQRARHVCLLALRRARTARPDFGLADVFGVSFAGRDRRPDAELVSRASTPIRPPAAAIRSSTGSTTRRGSSTACSGSTYAHAGRSRLR